MLAFRRPQHATRSVRCYRCDRDLEVSAKAQSAACPFCHRQIHIADVVILRAHWGGRIETSGKLIIHRKAAVRTAGARVVLAAEIYGEFTGSLECNGPVLLGPTAIWQGNLIAPRIDLTPGAVVLGGVFRICPQRDRSRVD